jgi:hypothetical protein
MRVFCLALALQPRPGLVYYELITHWNIFSCVLEFQHQQSLGEIVWKSMGSYRTSGVVHHDLLHMYALLENDVDLYARKRGAD